MSEGSRALSSWKVIAHHLGVNVRTAQKWGRERGLPVTRTAGGRVHTDAASLEAWRQCQATNSTRAEACYRWPVGSDVIAEVRFLGAAVTPEHIERLLQYLAVTKNALTH